MSIFVYFTAFVLAAMPMVAAAQAPSAAADPAAAVAPLEYTSVFEHYRPMAEDGGAPANRWRAANEEVARIGGHAGYMRAEQDAQANAAKDDPAERLPFTPHSGHTGHHGSHHH